MRIEEIKAYKTTDGKVYESKEEAEKQQAKIDYQNKLKTILEEVWYSGIEMDTVIECLIENREQLK